MRTDIKFTYQDLLTLPDTGPQYQLMDGELYKMSPSPTTRHQRIVMRISNALYIFVEPKRLGTIYMAPMDVILSDENVFQPDLLFVSKAREHLVRERGIFGPPDLCVEVLSPSNFDKPMDLKRRLYAKFGVAEFWLVDPATNRVEQFHLQEDVERPAATWTAAGRMAVLCSGRGWGFSRG